MDKNLSGSAKDSIHKKLASFNSKVCPSKWNNAINIGICIASPIKGFRPAKGLVLYFSYIFKILSLCSPPLNFFLISFICGWIISCILEKSFWDFNDFFAIGWIIILTKIDSKIIEIPQLKIKLFIQYKTMLQS